MMKVHWTDRFASQVFVLYVTYLAFCWTVLNYGGRGEDPYTGDGFRWLLITVPLLMFICVAGALLIVKGKLNITSPVIFLGLYTLCTTVSSALYFDLKHFSEVVRWAIPLIFVATFRMRAPLFVLNSVYIFSLVWLILTYDSSVTEFGYLPGQTTVNLHQNMWWRISIWSYLTPPYSAAFSIAIFFANYFLNHSKFRYFFYILTLYFIVLSGSRTSYVIFLIGLSLILFFDSKKFRLSLLFSVIPIASVVLIFAMQLMADLIPLLGIQNEYFNSAILRNPDAGGDAENLSSRLVIILEHLRIVQESDRNGLFGVGSEVYAGRNWEVNGGYLPGTADSYISHLMARDGVSVIFLVLAFGGFFYESMKAGNFLAYIVLLALLLYTVGYGAWLNFTSPVFLMLLGLLFHEKRGLTRMSQD